MKIHYIQHVEFEDLGYLEQIIQKNNWHLSSTKIFEGETFPDLRLIDVLIIMGGNMGINEFEKYPWLLKERDFIKEAINSNKKVLGICLGAQLIASILGAKVSKNEHMEIGWYPLTFSNTFSKWAKLHEQECNAFHWHADTFELPQGSVRIASSEACLNQGFIMGENILALQFHLEITDEIIKKLLMNCHEFKQQGKFIQKKSEILKTKYNQVPLYKILNKIINKFLN